MNFRLAVSRGLGLLLLWQGALILDCADLVRAQGGGPTWLEDEERIPVDLTGELYTLEGAKVSLDDYRGEVLFLNFWATWCGPCRAEMPSIASLHRELKGKGLQVIAVTSEDSRTVQAFMEHNSYPFTILIDRTRQLASRFGIWSIPWTLVLDQNGKLAHYHMGARLWDTSDVTDNLTSLLRE